MRQKSRRMTYATITIVLLTLALAAPIHAAKFKVLYAFQDGADGQFPYAPLVFDKAGNLYGTTSGYYGDGEKGTVFKLTRNPDGSWSETVIHTFNGSDGQYPYAGLIFDAAGNLYGSTTELGAYGGGTIFKLTPDRRGNWTETVIHNFNGDDGFSPVGELIFDTAGNLYGTTDWGGTYGEGTAFKLTPNPDGSWSETVLHGFGGEDGARPQGSLIFDNAGNLYGTTFNGGVGDNRGTVFKLTPNPDGTWSHTVIHYFHYSDGARPRGALVFDVAGNLYGTTQEGGSHGQGTVFKLTPNPDGSWTRSKVHSFNGQDGGWPLAGLIFDEAGNLYGTTYFGGIRDAGTAFKLTPNPDGSWKRTTLHAFKGTDGAGPYAGLIFDAAGNLYGTTQSGAKVGVVFRIKP